MTSLEIILTGATSLLTILMGGKYLWEYLKSKNSNWTKIKLSRIEMDEAQIKELRLKYDSLESNYKRLEAQHKQVVASLRTLLPLLERLAEDDAGLKGALSVIKEIMIEE